MPLSRRPSTRVEGPTRLTFLGTRVDAPSSRRRQDAQARQGRLDDDLRRIEAQALQLALDRRQVLLQMNAASARDAAILARPRRGGRGAGRAREV